MMYSPKLPVVSERYKGRSIHFVCVYIIIPFQDCMGVGTLGYLTKGLSDQRDV
jgi:hypothetical protein